MLKNSTCLVTGSSGFIGTHLCNRLISEGAIVVSFDKEDGGITNLPLVFTKCQNVDYVFHLGAISTVPSCTDKPLWANEVNVSGTLNLLMTCKSCKVRRFVFASSCVAKFAPQSMYAVTKQIGEMYCNLFSKAYNLPVSVLRLYNVYGPGQNSDTAVIPAFIKKMKIMSNGILSIEGSGNQTRDFVYVDDVVNAMVKVVEDNIDGIHEIGTGKEISVNELATLISDILKVPSNRQYVSSRAGDLDKVVAEKASWFKPQYTLAEGLKKTIESFK